MSEQVIVTVDENGEVKVAASGFAGKACTEATAAFIRSLGVAESDVPTAEMYSTSISGATVNIGGAK